MPRSECAPQSFAPDLWGAFRSVADPKAPSRDWMVLI